MGQIRNRIARALGIRPSTAGVRLPSESVTPLLRSLQVTLERELGCEEADSLMEAFAEALASGASAETLESSFRHHISMCTDCREEFEALIRAVAAATD